MKKKILTIALFFLLLDLPAQTITSSDLPLVVINTNGQTIMDDPKIMADMGIIYNGAGTRNNMTDPFNHYNGKIGIEIRGQSSQQFPMKSYSLELWDVNGNSVNRSLFGLPAESDWVLYAPYNEKTLMHNFLAYTMAREMGRWAANCWYVEVVINNDYKGIYVLMEKIKRNSARVNVTKLNAADVTGDAVTGGYIFSIDKEADGWFSSYVPKERNNNQYIQFSYIYPKITALVPAQKDYIKGYVDSFENAVNAASYQDKQNGWRHFADENSFIDYFITNEVSRNVDGYRLSTYFYKDRNSKGGKINAGPVWDYDLAFRNANYCKGSDTTGWAYQFNAVCPGDFWLVPFWWDRFLSDTAFQSNLKCRWNTLRKTSLSLSRLNVLIDSVVNITAEARQRHFQRWPVLGQYVWPNPQPIAMTYDGEIQTLKTWLADRLHWLDNNIPNKGACADYPSSVKESVIVSFFPNPFSTNNTVTIQSKYNQDISLKVLDATGRIISLQQYSVVAGSNTLSLPADGWAAGVYFMDIETNAAEKIVRTIVKQ